MGRPPNMATKNDASAAAIAPSFANNGNHRAHHECKSQHGRNDAADSGHGVAPGPHQALGRMEHHHCAGLDANLHALEIGGFNAKDERDRPVGRNKLSPSRA
jgi:hypothetical protein